MILSDPPTSLNCPLCKRGQSFCSCECSYCGAPIDWDGKDWTHHDFYEDDDHAPCPIPRSDLIRSHLELVEGLSLDLAAKEPKWRLVATTIQREVHRLLGLLRGVPHD